MKYYNSKQAQTMNEKFGRKDLVLQKYFSAPNTWGADVLFNEKGEIENIEICKLSDVTNNGETWTHYANVCRCDDDTAWEINTQFNGDSESAMWVYMHYKRFADAIRFVATCDFKTLKPLYVY